MREPDHLAVWLSAEAPSLKLEDPSFQEVSIAPGRRSSREIGPILTPMGASRPCPTFESVYLHRTREFNLLQAHPVVAAGRILRVVRLQVSICEVGRIHQPGRPAAGCDELRWNVDEIGLLSEVAQETSQLPWARDAIR